MYPCVEDTLDITVQNRKLRLWIDVPSKDLSMFAKSHVQLGREITEMMRQTVSDRKLLEWALSLPNVNAVQIIILGNFVDHGMVVYKVPFEDIKG